MYKPGGKDFAVSLLGDFSELQRIAFLMWPDSEVRRERLATVGVAILGRLQAHPTIAFFDRAIEASADGIPPEGARDRIIREVTNDRVVQKSLVDLSLKILAGNLSLLELSSVASASPEVLFWSCMRIPELRAQLNEILRSLDRHVHNRLIAPAGGLSAFAEHGTNFLAIEDDPHKGPLGFPMLAGLTLLLIASLDEMEKDETLIDRVPIQVRGSLNLATEIINAAVHTRRTSKVQRRLKGDEVWHHWRWFAPVWAGVLAEAHGGAVDWFRKPALLMERVGEVIADERRYERAFRYARWLADWASTHAGKGSRGSDRHIPASEMIEVPEWIGCEKPPLLRFEAWIFEAVSDLRKQGRKNAERMRTERKALRENS